MSLELTRSQSNLLIIVIIMAARRPSHTYKIQIHISRTEPVHYKTHCALDLYLTDRYLYRYYYNYVATFSTPPTVWTWPTTSTTSSTVSIIWPCRWAWRLILAPGSCHNAIVVDMSIVTTGASYVTSPLLLVRLMVIP